ncbi:MAG: hypothetical protein WAO95_02710 [Burkholderiales bacterium]
MRIAYALVAALAMGGAHAQPHPPTIPKPVCSPIPQNWKLGARPVPFEEVDKKLGATHKNRGWDAYKKGRRSEDQYREFSDGKSQGILVTRLGCLNSYFITK